MPAPHTYSTSWFDGNPKQIEGSLIWMAATLSNRFAAVQFGIEGGEGGYVGLQQFADGRPNRAIFSVWGGEPLSDNAEYVNELGVLVAHAHIDYPWVMGRRYTMGVMLVSDGPKGALRKRMVGTVYDGATMTLIGEHKVANEATSLSAWVVYFVELFGETQCVGRDRTSVVWFPPTGVGVQEVRVHRRHHVVCGDGGYADVAYYHESGGDR